MKNALSTNNKNSIFQKDNVEVTSFNIANLE